MPVTFPWTLRTTNLRLVSGKTMRASESGLIVTSQFREPSWQGDFSTPPLTRSERSEALAWLDDCVDRNLRIDFIHPLYRYPSGYSNSTWPLVADPVLISVNSPREITVSGLSSGLTLPKGTRLSIIQSDRVCYRRLAENVVSPSAISETFDVGPRIPMGVFAPGALVRFELPHVRMMVVPDSWDATEDVEDTPVHFSMMETIQ